ncbi:BCCT family transporter [Escherichia coli]
MNNWTLLSGHGGWHGRRLWLVPARIARGRTIRQFVLGTLLFRLPSRCYGSRCSAIARCMKSSTAARRLPKEAMVRSGAPLLQPLAQCPAFTFSVSVATITRVVYVTSADSVRWCWGNFTSQLKDIDSDAPGWLRVLSSVAIGLLTLGMLIITGYPRCGTGGWLWGCRSLVIFFVMAGLSESLKVEDYRRESANAIPPAATGASGSPELEKTSLAPDELSGHAFTKEMMETVCYRQWRSGAELRLRGAYVELNKPAAGRGTTVGASGFVGAYRRRQNFVLSDLAAAIFGAGRCLPRT